MCCVKDDIHFALSYLLAKFGDVQIFEQTSPDYMLKMSGGWP